MSSQDYSGVVRTAHAVSADIGRVTGHPSAVLVDTLPASPQIVVAGTLGGTA